MQQHRDRASPFPPPTSTPRRSPLAHGFIALAVCVALAFPGSAGAAPATPTLSGVTLTVTSPPSVAGIPALTVNVRAQFSAKGDGVTDDSKAIQNAIDHVAAQGGGTVFLPAGTYLVNSLADNQPTTLPYTDPTAFGPNGYSQQLWLRSGVRLLGAGPRASILKMPAGSRTNALDRLHRRNRAIAVIGDPAYDAVLRPDRGQHNIEIDSLGFDLDNGISRRAIQIRGPVRNVRIHHCEGFQSDLERGAAPIDGIAGDNHFINMASAGAPLRRGDPSSWVHLPENVTIDHCKVNGLMQLTSDGGSGSRNLWIHHNIVDNALSFAIALTSTGAIDALFEDVLIEDNTINAPNGAGIFVGENYIGTDMDLAPVRLHSFSRVIIRRNTVRVSSTPAPGLVWREWAPNAAGILLNSGLLETRDIRIEDNVFTADNSNAQPTSRQAFRIGSWDFNWEQKWMREHGGAKPSVNAAAFNAADDTISMPGHGLADGMEIQFRPLSAAPLPAGLEAHRSYRIARLDRDRFAVTLPGSPDRVGFSAATSGAFAISAVPAFENIVIARNRVVGAWDWDAAIWGTTRGLTIRDNDFISRFNLDGTHEQLDFSHNRSTGTLALRDATVRRGTFSGNSWTIREAANARHFGPGIITLSGTSDPWRHVDATFTGNIFSFSSAFGASRQFAAIWMNRTDWMPPHWSAWTGGASLRFAANRFDSQSDLTWGLEPAFVSGWSDNDGRNTLGTIAENTTGMAPAANSQAVGSKLTGLSVRALAGQGAQTLIVGFAVAGSESKRVLLRGIGPSLTSFGVANPVPDPRLELRRAASIMALNDNWGQAADPDQILATAARVGAFPLPTGSLDAAIVRSIESGGYSAHYSSPADTRAVALVELYDANPEGQSRLTNLSARAYAGPGEAGLFAGFTIEGGAAKTILVRGIGPGLAQFGVAEALARPTLDLRSSSSGSSAPLATARAWAGAAHLSEAFARTGAFPLTANSADAALLVTLPPGSYTAQVSDPSGPAGVALVEVYEVP